MSNLDDLKKLSELGSATAQNKLGEIYLLGQGVPQDYEEAFYWFDEAAKRRNANAQYNLGTMYENGYGVPQDYEKACVWYKKAMMQGNDVAKKRVAAICEIYDECYGENAKHNVAFAQIRLNNLYDILDIHSGSDDPAAAADDPAIGMGTKGRPMLSWKIWNYFDYLGQEERIRELKHLFYVDVHQPTWKYDSIEVDLYGYWDAIEIAVDDDKTIVPFEWEGNCPSDIKKFAEGVKDGECDRFSWRYEGKYYSWEIQRRGNILFTIPPTYTKGFFISRGEFLHAIRLDGLDERRRNRTSPKEFTVGDYSFKEISCEDVSVKVRNTDLEEYDPIPFTVEYGGIIFTVTDMDSCFCGCSSLVKAPVIPDSVTNMYYCFDSCTSLAEAPVIPDSVWNMAGCFAGCTSLAEAPVIPDSVRNMEGCFADCTSLVVAPVIHNGVTNMKLCFEWCTSLVKPPAIPNSVTNLQSCFLYCDSLEKAPVIPDSVTNMKECFFGCTSLVEAPTIPDGVENMDYCFGGCTSLKEIPT